MKYYTQMTSVLRQLVWFLWTNYYGFPLDITYKYFFFKTLNIFDYASLIITDNRLGY